jgi:hypothetical protein
MTKKQNLRQIDYACEVGERVKWETIAGRKFEGVIIDWDNYVAIVKLDDGTEKAIEC